MLFHRLAFGSIRFCLWEDSQWNHCRMFFLHNSYLIAKYNKESSTFSWQSGAGHREQHRWKVIKVCRASQQLAGRWQWLTALIHSCQLTGDCVRTGKGRCPQAVSDQSAPSHLALSKVFPLRGNFKTHKEGKQKMHIFMRKSEVTYFTIGVDRIFPFLRQSLNSTWEVSGNSWVLSYKRQNFVQFVRKIFKNLGSKTIECALGD